MRFSLQLTKLTIVSNALMGALSTYQQYDDEAGINEVKGAIKALSEVVSHLTKLNILV